jgi:excisionase family DNA binding protein
MTDPLDSLRALIAELVRVEVAKLAPLATNSEFLSVNRAAEVADVAPGTIRRWVREGALPDLRAGKHVRVKRSDLERLLRGEGKRKKTGRDETPEEWAARKFG